MKRFLTVTLVLLAIGAFAVTPAFAMDSCDDTMSHDATIAALTMHVQHAYDMGHIYTVGTETSLLAILNRAAAAESQGNVKQAVRVLQAFVQAVGAQSGQQIDPTCADHLIMQAEHTIMALQGTM